MSVSYDEALNAVQVLLRWAGEDPTREGLRQTPDRVVRAFQEYSWGYDQSPEKTLQTTFEEIGTYEDPILLKDIPFTSLCEHHLAPISGKVHIAYLPHKRVVGISKLARVVDIFSKRLQIQEKMTAQIADAIDQALHPRGVFVLVDAQHHCLSGRGIHKRGVSMVTSCATGIFRENRMLVQEIKQSLRLISS